MDRTAVNDDRSLPKTMGLFIMLPGFSNNSTHPTLVMIVCTRFNETMFSINPLYWQVITFIITSFIFYPVAIQRCPNINPQNPIII